MILLQIRFHDLRHTYTSLLIAQGENVKFIQSQLGHASIQTTMDRYGHLLSVDRVGVGTKLDKLVFSDQGQFDGQREEVGNIHKKLDIPYKCVV